MMAVVTVILAVAAVEVVAEAGTGVVVVVVVDGWVVDEIITLSGLVTERWPLGLVATQSARLGGL